MIPVSLSPTFVPAPIAMVEVPLAILIAPKAMADVSLASALYPTATLCL